jgi:hypothetical protein
VKRLLVAAPVAFVALVVGAGPAAGHEEISPSTVGLGRAVFLTLYAANERQVAVTGVTLTPPSGLSLGPASREPPGWAAERGPEGISWSGGQLAPGRFEEWEFELEAPDQPGAFTFRSTLRFANGRADAHDVVLTVAGPVPPADAPATTGPPPTTSTGTPAALPATAVPEGGDDDDVAAARRRANLAAGVGGVSALVSVVALVVAARRSPARRPAGGEEQEW